MIKFVVWKIINYIVYLQIIYKLVIVNKKKSNCIKIHIINYIKLRYTIVAF